MNADNIILVPNDQSEVSCTLTAYNQVDTALHFFSEFQRLCASWPKFNSQPAAANLIDLIMGTPFPEFDLKILLATTPSGIAVLNFYKENNKLDEKNRNRLVDVIIRHIFDYITKWYNIKFC